MTKRLEFIRDTLEQTGIIRRAHLMREFGISEPQASNDIAAAKDKWPTLMSYNGSRKAYVFTGSPVPRDDGAKPPAAPPVDVFICEVKLRSGAFESKVEIPLDFTPAEQKAFIESWLALMVAALNATRKLTE